MIIHQQLYVPSYQSLNCDPDMFAARINRLRSTKICTPFVNKFEKRFNSGESNKQTAYYVGGIVALVFGLSYASVPLYKVFCQVTGFGGTGIQKTTEDKAITIKPADGSRILTVKFESMVPDTMPWTFTPTQREVKIVPGETALAFYTAKNNSDKAIIGVATYNVIPSKSEQRLEPGEEIDMPVFFFIDPEFLDDPALANCNSIMLSYTFFKTGEEEMPSITDSRDICPLPASKKEVA